MSDLPRQNKPDDSHKDFQKPSSDGPSQPAVSTQSSFPGRPTGKKTQEDKKKPLLSPKGPVESSTSISGTGSQEVSFNLPPSSSSASSSSSQPVSPSALPKAKTISPPDKSFSSEEKTPPLVESAQEKKPSFSEDLSSTPAAPVSKSPSEKKPPSAVSPPAESAGAESSKAEVSPLESGQKFSLSGLKKFLPFILAILAFLGLMLVILKVIWPRLKSGETEIASGEASLTYWGLWEPETVMGVVLADWEKEHPEIKINYQQQSIKEYRERLQSALARGEGPDLFRFHNTWTPMFKNELAPVPASLMDAQNYQKSFYPVAASSLRSGANYLGIPLEIDTLALFYNTDFFQEAGVSPPQTWEKLRELASRLTVRDKDGQIIRAGVALGTTNNVWHWSDILALMMLQNGADLSNPTDTLAQDALTFYTLFTKTDGVWDEFLPDSVLAFATGKTAMMFGFSWDVFEVLALNPDLNFRTVPVPQLPGTNLAWASFWVEGVSQKSENKQEAWEFLKFLSSRETLEKLYEAQSKIRLFGEPYSRTSMANLVQEDPLAAPFVSQASHAQTWYLCSRTFDNGINDRMIQYFKDAVNSVVEGGNAAQALNTAASGVSQILATYDLVR